MEGIAHEFSKRSTPCWISIESADINFSNEGKNNKSDRCSMILATRIQERAFIFSVECNILNYRVVKIGKNGIDTVVGHKLSK